MKCVLTSDHPQIGDLSILICSVSPGRAWTSTAELSSEQKDVELGLPKERFYESAMAYQIGLEGRSKPCGWVLADLLLFRLLVPTNSAPLPLDLELPHGRARGPSEPASLSHNVTYVHYVTWAMWRSN
jgi:hypothetical protein